MKRVLLASAAMCAAPLIATPALAQTSADTDTSAAALDAQLTEQEESVEDEIAELEARLAQLKQDRQTLEAIRRQLDALRRKPADRPPDSTTTRPADRSRPAPPEPASPAGQAASDIPKGPKDIIANSAILDANQFRSRPSGYSGSFVVPEFSFGSSDRASIGVEVPLIFRGNPCGNDSDKGCETQKNGDPTKVFPNVVAVSASVSTPLTEGEGLLFKRKDEDDFDYLTGTSVTVGLDWYGFEPRGYKEIREQAADYIIAKLRPKCQALHGFDSDKCKGAQLAGFLREKNAKKEYINAEEIDAIDNMYWRAPEKADRWWGIGGSVSYSSIDYAYVDGFVTEVTDEDGIVSLVPVLTGILPDAMTESRDNWLFEVHAYRSFKLKGIGTPMLTFQLQRKEQYSFREGAEQNVCTESTGNGFTIQKCENRFLEEPVYDPQTIVSLGTRWRIIRKPFEIAVAPEWRYVLENGQRVWDLPVYFGSGDSLKGGIRLRLKRGGTDLLGNERASEDQISIFFTPFTFHGF